MSATIDAKHPLDDFFAGLTPICSGYSRLCGKRRPTKDRSFCSDCQAEKEHEEFKNKFAERSIAFKTVWETAKQMEREKYADAICNSWYMRHQFSFVCLVCGREHGKFAFGVQRKPNGPVEPAMGCCVNKECELANEFWGSAELAFDRMQSKAIQYASERAVIERLASEERAVIERFSS